MTYKLRAGAPFDLDNIFNIPALDPGPFVNPYPDLIVSVVDCGSFTDPVEITYDGGTIPLVGTASFDPTKTYGPDDIITE